MSNYKRRGRYLVPTESSRNVIPSDVRVVSGVNGPVYMVGSSFAQPVDAPDEGKAGTAELIAELERQKRSRERT